MRITTGGVTDMGRVRTNNEDCYKIVEPLQLFVLSDGMGGEAHGEIASAMAVETVVNHCLDIESNPATRKVLPCPTSLATAIRPPGSSAGLTRIGVLEQNAFLPPSILPTRTFSSPPKKTRIGTAWAPL